MLQSEDILRGYRAGIFPMADPQTEEIDWYSPNPRAVIPLESANIPRVTRRASKRYRVSFDQAFERVIDACSDRPTTWISREIREAYVELFRRGNAHSVESWQEEELAGGLYGVHIGGAFMGESMFFRKPEASKVALAALIEHLKKRGFVLLDTQMVTPTTRLFGAVEIPRREYLKRLEKALKITSSFL